MSRRPRADRAGRAPRPRAGRRAAAVLAAVLAAGLTAALAGCSAGAPAPSGGGRPVTAWESIAGQVRPDGAVGVGTALQAFSLAIGPLPGATAPAGSRSPIYTAGGPVRWLQRRWAELTPEQRSAAAAYLRPPQQTAAAGAALMAARPAIVGLGDSPGAAPYRAIVDDAIARIGGATGVPLQVTTTIVLGATPPPGNVGAWAYTEPLDANFAEVGPEAHCFIFVNTRMTQAAPNIQRATLAHETFHCLQAQMMGSSAAYLTAPAWLVEGQAEWVGETYAGGTPVSEQWWRLYLTKPLTPLFERSYDAVGFYAHLEESGVDPWKRFSPMLTAGGSAAAYARAMAGHEPAFLDSWAAGLAREASWGAGWDTTGPGITQDRASVQTTTVGGGFSDTVDPYSNNVSQADLAADVVTFVFRGHGRLHASDGTTYHATDLDGRSFCTRAGGCAGPGGCRASASLPAMARGIAYLALSAGAGHTTFQVRGRDLAGLCSGQPTPTPSPSPTPTQPAGGSCRGAASNADLVRALGGPVTATNVTTDPPHGLQVCGFAGPTGRGAITVTDDAAYETAIADPRCGRLAVGDGACTLGGNIIYMQSRGVHFAIAVQTSRGQAADAAATLQLARVVAAR